MSYKFIFDNSAIDCGSIPKMKDARLITACNSGKLDFYMTAPLLRECSHCVTSGNMPQKTAGNLEFLVNIKWAGFLNQLNGKDGILNMELAGLPEDEFLLIKNGETIFKPQLRNIVNGRPLFKEICKKLDDDGRLWRSAKEKLINGALNKRANLANSIDIPGNIPPYEGIWEKFSATIVPHYITGIAEKINPDVSVECLISLWKERQRTCRWLENFIKLHYFQQWDLITSKAEPARDKNTADDIEHMIYLLFVDGMVCEEKRGFMSNAKQFFPTKEVLSVDEFVGRIKNG